MSTISNANVRATKATGAHAKKESGKTPGKHCALRHLFITILFSEKQ